MRVLWILLFAASASAISCAGPSDEPHENYCADQFDPETGRAIPNCANVGTASAPDWQCKRCAVNCDCDVGEYCVRGPGPSAGDCATLSSSGKLGAPCTQFGFPGTIGARVPTYGEDDGAVCGSAKVSFFPLTTPGFPMIEIPSLTTRRMRSSDSNGSDRAEKVRSCATLQSLTKCQGACYQCAGDTAAWAIAMSTQVSAVVVPAPNGSAWDGGSLLRSDRYCYRGTVMGAPSWFFENYPTGVITAIFVAVFLIMLTFVVTAVHECCTRRRIGRAGAAASPSVADDMFATFIQFMREKQAHRASGTKTSKTKKKDETRSSEPFVIGDDIEGEFQDDTVVFESKKQ
jgi:hypothetical protein